MTNEEIKYRCQVLARTTRSDEELKQRIKEEFHTLAAVTSTEWSGMRIVMGMIISPNDGSIISF